MLQQQTKVKIGNANQEEKEEDLSEINFNPVIECRLVDCSTLRSSLNKSKSLSFFHLNIGSLSKHLDQLQTLINDLKFDILAITETRITDKSIPHNYEIKDYNFIYTKTEAAAGGRGIFIKNTISFKVRDDIANKIYKQRTLESTFVELTIPSHANIVVGCIYKHPHMPKSDFTDDHLSFILNKLNKERKKAVILRDFNINLLNDNSNEVIDFLTIIASNTFVPTITIPTRISEHSETLIDNILTNITEKTLESGNLAVGISDHFPQFLLIKSSFKKDIKCNHEQHYNDWNSFDEIKFVEDVRNVNWDEILQLNKLDPDISFQNFYNCLDNFLKIHVPKRRISKKQQSSKPWITRKIKKAIIRRNKLSLSLAKENDPIMRGNIHRQYKILRNEITKEIRENKRNYYRNYFVRNLKNSKNTWKGIKELITLKKNQPVSNIELKTGNDLVYQIL